MALVLVLARVILTCASGAVVAVDTGMDWAAAVLGAPEGASVVFAPGTYEGCATGGLEPALDVSLVGSAGAAITIIDCKGSGRHLRVRVNISVIVQGLTLRGGRADGGSGGCALADGGAVLSFQDSIVSNCNAAHGGAVSVSGGGVLNLSGTNITSSSAANDGGAIHADNSTVALSRAQLRGNTAGGAGGALCAVGGSRVSLDGGDVRGNTAGGDGGGLAVLEASTLTVLFGTPICPDLPRVALLPNTKPSTPFGRPPDLDHNP